MHIPSRVVPLPTLSLRRVGFPLPLDLSSTGPYVGGRGGPEPLRWVRLPTPLTPEVVGVKTPRGEGKDRDAEVVVTALSGAPV